MTPGKGRVMMGGLIMFVSIIVLFATASWWFMLTMLVGCVMFVFGDYNEWKP
jgi:hypothetical protein